MPLRHGDANSHWILVQLDEKISFCLNFLTQVFKNSDVPAKTIFKRDLQCNFAKAFWQKKAAVQSNRDRIDGTFVFMRDANLGNNAVFGIFIIPLEEDSYRDGDSS